MKKTRHSLTELKYHLVFIPKYRKCILKRSLNDLVSELIPHLIDDLNGDCIEFSVQDDHVHVHFETSSTTLLSSFVGKLKSQSSKICFDTFPQLEDYLGSRNLWARGYYLSTTGIDSETVRSYIRNQ